jgi:hypothetical protein
MTQRGPGDGTEPARRSAVRRRSRVGQMRSCQSGLRSMESNHRSRTAMGRRDAQHPPPLASSCDPQPALPSGCCERPHNSIINIINTPPFTSQSTRASINSNVPLSLALAGWGCKRPRFGPCCPPSGRADRPPEARMRRASVVAATDNIGLGRPSRVGRGWMKEWRRARAALRREMTSLSARRGESRSSARASGRSLHPGGGGA